jgi:hypothetical protein
VSSAARTTGLVLIAALLTGSIAALVSNQRSSTFQAVAVVPVEEPQPSGNVRKLIGVEPAAEGDRRGGAHLLPTGNAGLSLVVRRTARRLGVPVGEVSRSVRVEDSVHAEPTFLEETATRRPLRVRATAGNRMQSRRLARTFADEYVTYRREVVDEEGQTAIAAVRTSAAVVRSDSTSDPSAFRRRAHQIAIALLFDRARLGSPRLEQAVVRRSGTPLRSNFLVGAAVGALFCLLAIQRKPRARPAAT